MTDLEPSASVAEPQDQPSIGDALRALVEDAQTLVEAEIAYRKAQAAYGLGQAKTIAILLVLGLAFGFFTLLAIVVGLLLALSAYIGVWGALAIVGGALLILTIICLFMASARMKRTKDGFAGQEQAE